MKPFNVLAVSFAFTLILCVMGTPSVFAADGNVTIKSPSHGSVVKGSSMIVEMEIDKGTRGDHVHFYIDGKNKGVVRTDTYKLDSLAKGKHTIEARLASKSHAELGPRGTAEFTVE